MSLRLRPITFRQACAFVGRLHRHHRKPRGHKFSIGVGQGNLDLVGVVMVGRPVARGLDDGYTAEVTRCCTDGTPNACSILYGAAARAAKAMGYTEIVTYTLASELGASLRASGWRKVAAVRGRSWSARAGREQTSARPTTKCAGLAISQEPPDVVWNRSRHARHRRNRRRHPLARQPLPRQPVQPARVVTMRVIAQTIRIPHLCNYRVRIRIAPKTVGAGFSALCERDGRFGATIYVRSGVTPFTMAHEIMHVLRHICSDLQMDFIKESEHMAYLMQWMLGKAFGWDFCDKEGN